MHGGTSRDERHGQAGGDQHGVVALPQLIDIGFTRDAVWHRCERGLLYRVLPQVYSVTPSLTRAAGRMMAAVLSCAPGAGLTHRAGAAVWDLGPWPTGVIDVSTRTRKKPRRGVRLHLVTTSKSSPTTASPSQPPCAPSPTWRPRSRGRTSSGSSRPPIGRPPRRRRARGRVPRPGEAAASSNSSSTREERRRAARTSSNGLCSTSAETTASPYPASTSSCTASRWTPTGRSTTSSSSSTAGNGTGRAPRSSAIGEAERSWKHAASGCCGSAGVS